MTPDPLRDRTRPQQCPICGKDYESHPFIGVMTCFLHPSEAERNWGRSQPAGNAA